MTNIGVNEERARSAIAGAELDKAREYANTLLDELISSRRELAARITAANPVPVWATAVEALRRLADQPSAFGRVRTDSDALRRAADWLAAIGPDTNKSPCEVCLKPTSIGCSRCRRSLCSTHVAFNMRTRTHDHGRLNCER